MKRILGAALLYPLCFSLSCSNTSGSSGPSSPNGSGSDNGGTGSTSSTGSNNNAGSGAFVVGTSGGSGSQGGGCASDESDAQLTRVNIVFLLDKSGSMGDNPPQWTNAADRWNPVVTTLRAFFQDQKSSGIYASLSFLPADGNIGPACKVANYETGTSSIKVPMTLLDDAGRALFLSKLCDPTVVPQPAGCIVPAGGTPTRPALQGTIDYANSVQSTVQSANPNSKTVIVFLTDGEPGFGYSYNGTVVGLYSCDDLPPLASDGNTPSCACGCCAAGCSPASLCACGTASCGCVEDSTLCTTGDAEVLRVRDVIATAPAKSIYLFGVGDLTQSTMQIWGDATGNAPVALQGMPGSQAAATLATALDNIRSTYISCNVPIPKSQGGAAIDINKVNVDYVDGTGKTTHLGKSQSCTSAQPSWQYDDPTNPTTIVLCTNTCSTIQQDPQGKIEVVFGCATVVY